MGCDIHLHVERRAPTGWRCADDDIPRVPCDVCHGTGESDGKRPCFWCHGRTTVSGVYRDRNYSLFAILANVRNGVGFGGCDTGDRFAPTVAPRSVPDDASDCVLRAAAADTEIAGRP
jgi:hypothetical protein